MILRSSLSLAALSAALVACAPLPVVDSVQFASNDTAQPSRCFYVSQVSGYQNASPQGLLVRASQGRTFEGTFVGRCPEIDTGMSSYIKLKAEKAVGSRVCNGDYVRLTVESRETEHSQCRLRIVRLLTPEETAPIGTGNYTLGRTAVTAE